MVYKIFLCQIRSQSYQTFFFIKRIVFVRFFDNKLGCFRVNRVNALFSYVIKHLSLNNENKEKQSFVGLTPDVQRQKNPTLRPNEYSKYPQWKKKI